MVNLVTDDFMRVMAEADYASELYLLKQERLHMTRDDLRLMHERLCEEARDLMRAKNADYATETDIFRNFRMFGALGMLVRMSDKLARLRSFSEKGSLQVKDESVRDTIKDLINYAVLFQAYIEDEK